MYLVVVAFPDYFFCFLDGLEDVGFSLIVSVGSDAEIYFIIANVLLESEGSTQNRIGRSHLYTLEYVILN